MARRLSSSFLFRLEKRIRTEAKRKGKEPGHRTLEAAAYTFLLTTVPRDRITDEEVSGPSAQKSTGLGRDRAAAGGLRFV
jgi:hypothetical protein